MKSKYSKIISDDLITDINVAEQKVKFLLRSKGNPPEKSYMIGLIKTYQSTLRRYNKLGYIKLGGRYLVEIRRCELIIAFLKNKHNEFLGKYEFYFNAQ